MQELSIIIEDWNPKRTTDFMHLNIEWLEKYFSVEPIDLEILSNPQKIIDNGGAILFATVNTEAVGCCALMWHKDKNAYELTKMAVTESYQGKGIGNQLLYVALEEFKKFNHPVLFLESQTGLKPAINLYKKFGFIRKNRPFISKYNRSDIYMEWINV